MNTQIQLNDKKDIVYSSFVLHKNGLSPVGNPTFEQWQECGNFIKKANGASHLWLGDWLNYGEAHYQEDYTQAIDATGYDYHTLRRDKYTTERIPFERRRSNIDISIYHEIAPFEEKEQERLLDIVEKTKMTIQQLRKEKHRLVLENKRPPTTIDTNLILGDCLTELIKIPDNSVDCIITDPPYGIDYQSNFREATPQFDKLQNDKETAIELLDKCLAISRNKLKINSHAYIFTSWKVYSYIQNIVKKYFQIKNVLVWVKSGGMIGDLEADYMDKYEMIIYATKGRRLLNGIRESNVLNYDRPSSTKYHHPTEKPVELLKYLISKSSNENELILDPFMGSGSTCVAAKETKRKYLGIEIDKQWFDEAQRRINGND